MLYLKTAVLHKLAYIFICTIPCNNTLCSAKMAYFNVVKHLGLLCSFTHFYTCHLRNLCLRCFHTVFGRQKEHSACKK